MEKKQTPQIKIEEGVKTRLDRYKKNGTYTMVIDSFLNYFETTGIKPTDVNLSPLSIVKDSTERVVKILRKIELTKINQLILLSELIIENQKNTGNKIETSHASEQVTNEEAQGLVDKIGILELELKSKDKEISILNGKLSQKLEQKTDNKHIEIFKQIKIYCQQLDKEKTESKLKRDDWQIEKNLFSRNMESINNLINDVI